MSSRVCQDGTQLGFDSEWYKVVSSAYFICGVGGDIVWDISEELASKDHVHHMHILRQVRSFLELGRYQI